MILGASEASKREVEEEMKRDSKGSTSCDSSRTTRAARPKSLRNSKCDAAPIKLKQLQTNADGSLSYVQRNSPHKHELSGTGESSSSSSNSNASSNASSGTGSSTSGQDAAVKFVPRVVAQRYGTKKTGNFSLTPTPTSTTTPTLAVAEGSKSASSSELPESKFVPRQVNQRYGTKKKM